MPLYRVVSKFLSEAEILIEADNTTDALRSAREYWPDGHWRCHYGGAELKPPDKSEILSIHIGSIETDRTEEGGDGWNK